jgi:cellulose synthase/poly-beta-1,6-N-acetylglucosamine synthase-like glycosyltransferase
VNAADVLTLLGLIGAAGLALVWVVYPLVMRAISALRRDEPPSPAEEPMVSVIVATREDEATIRRRVTDLLRAAYAREKLEVIVAVDARGSHATPEALAELSAGGRVTVVAGDEPGGKAATLNAGVRAARGEVLVFADSSQHFEPAAIGIMARRTMAGHIGAVSGCLHLPDDGVGKTIMHAYWDYEVALRDSEARVHSSVGVFGPVWAMRRSLWRPLPAALILDDVYTPMRLVLEGHRVAFAKDAIAYDTRVPAPGSEFRRKVRTLTGVIQLCAWLPAVLVPFRNPIWAQFVTHKLLRLLTPYLLLLIAISAGGAVVMALGARRVLIALALAAVLAALLAARSGIRARMREALLWGVGIQAAVVVAALNGLRGRWDVWHR